ncbi:MAG: DUF6527 family protein [Phycisphaeraceae bacterium]
MIHTLLPVFIDSIPRDLEEGRLYVSRKYETAVHKCCCGCGHKVVTPLSPTYWKLHEQDGKVSLYPSIGNWSFPCRSHYWIVGNQVQWSYAMTQEEIEAGRRHDARLKDQYFSTGRPEAGAHRSESLSAPEQQKSEQTLWKKFKRWLLG